MSEAVVDDIVAVLPPLLQSLEALGFVARHLNPPDFGRVMEAAGTPDEALRAVRPRLAQWPEEFAGIRTALETSSDAALASFDGLRAVQNGTWRSRQLCSRRCVTRPARRRRCIRCRPNCRRSANSSSIRTCARMPISLARLAAPANATPVFFTTTTNPAAAAASRSTCPNITRPIAHGRW